ncbi:trypsin-like serine protease [Vibrio sp. V27_P1S3P104]|uniref:S1 family peptidase n=1 Tax=unclassified Vibrio TaxID=2614977 RepID=UPI0013730039|nr:MULTISPECIES: serine protease [unclassified Vibrio]NAW68344.1 trypsin-like serine protease [Vibrio sp. V28_P6S34P95]NAX04752.1 trypsin-like serine protease [Vibrio sp. V30_P3S12P165]NAX33213.1 trypsin-like serine protease [Vibrio sp. V29_P1S30P107]NAX35976.1 trypsin-like serine protease [Vibrio sp. V27_P1S3P104]
MYKSIWVGVLASVFASQISANTHNQQWSLDQWMPRIIEGEESDVNAWPFMTALVKNNAINTYKGQFCGASYLGGGWVLTAAHCVERINVNDFHVHIGVHNLLKTASEDENEGERAEIKAVYVNEKYAAASDYSNDIALIELRSKPNADAVALKTTEGDLSEGQLLTVMGWGNTVADRNHPPHYPSVLRQVDVPYVPRTTCQNLNGAYAKIGNDAICAGFPEGGYDSCQGDSGGPLVVKEGDNVQQVGIVSWGNGCAQPNAYGVYANVAYFQDWIAKIKELGISYSQYTYRKVTQPSVEEELVIENTSDTALSILDIELEPDSKLTITTNTCLGETLEPSTSCSIHLTSTSKKLFPRSTDAREVQQLTVTTNRENNEKLSFALMFERDQENKEVTTSSSGGSISWSLLGLGLLGWFRFRQGVKW